MIIHALGVEQKRANVFNILITSNLFYKGLTQNYRFQPLKYQPN